MTEQTIDQAANKIEADWREDVSGPTQVLKIAHGESVIFSFVDEGERKSHPDYGTSIVFRVDQQGEEKNWYVNASNYNLLGQIKELGKLAGLKVKLSRKGSLRSDTRYTITKM